MKNTLHQRELPPHVESISKSIARNVIALLRLAPFYEEDICQTVLIRLAPMVHEYLPGEQSLHTFLFRRAKAIESKIVRAYRTDKRAEVLNRAEAPQNDDELADKSAWLERLVTYEENFAFKIDFADRIKQLTPDEVSLIEELSDGLCPRESNLGWTEAKRRKIHKQLQKKFADFRISTRKSKFSGK